MDGNKIYQAVIELLKFRCEHIKKKPEMIEKVSLCKLKNGYVNVIVYVNDPNYPTVVKLEFCLNYTKLLI